MKVQPSVLDSDDEYQDPDGLLSNRNNHLARPSFPFLELEKVAEQESWRKEIYRPIYHIHKWWAQRLGSVFRATIMSCFETNQDAVWNNFFKINDYKGKVVLDPFMGSGTTIGEAIKLGVRPIGCDINPVSTFAVRQSLKNVDQDILLAEYNKIESDVKADISQYYKTLDPRSGAEIDVLYYFWVKVVQTPDGEKIPLFRSYVFSKNAYPSKFPKSKILCPECGEINTDNYNVETTICTECDFSFNPQLGKASRQTVKDKKGNIYKIKELIKGSGSPPEHKLYAILAKDKNNKRLYLKPQKHDFDLFEKASSRLQKEELLLPDMELRQGNNTIQAMGYNYNNWYDFFNERQLLCLGLLFKRVLAIKNTDVREQFICLFSSTLEFNNLFCSFKGEGTGAVRHMFSHHILKPEKVPLENSVFGDSKTSGTFASLFKSRLLKAKDYLNNPTEVYVRPTDGKAEKILASKPINAKVVDNWLDFSSQSGSVLIVNGDSSKLNIPDKSVDAVVTDPPYFDYVHYSELSDFFYSWLSVGLKDDYDYFNSPHSGNANEVQDKNSDAFTKNLCRVFQECHRVMVDDGVLIFSFHHSKAKGWASIYSALAGADFSIVSSSPVKAEMSGGTPKNTSKNPINYDAMLVCKKKKLISKLENSGYVDRSNTLIREIENTGRKLSSADKYVIKVSQQLVEASSKKLSADQVLCNLKDYEE